MRNAEASIDPPTDPFAAVSPTDKKHPVRPGSASLPKGVSADIFGGPAAQPKPAVQVPNQGGLPPAVPPVEPWPMIDNTPREEPPPPTLASGPEPKGHLLRNTLIVAFALLLLAYLVPAMFMAGRVLPGTTVLGIDIGGQTAAQAVETLRGRLSGQAATAIVVRRGTRRMTVTPEAAGLRFDPEKTIAQVPIGFPTPRDVWAVLMGGREIKPQISVDKSRLAAAVAQIVAPVFEKPVKEGGVEFRGTTPVEISPKEGWWIDQARVAEDIQRAYLSTDVLVEVFAMWIDPKVSAKEVDRSLAWAKTAVSAPITLTNGTASVRIPVETLAANLSFVPDQEGALRPVFDGAKAIARLEPQLIDPDVAARDAGFTIRNGRPTLVASRDGKIVDIDRLNEDVIDAMGGGSRTVPISVVSGPARLTDSEASQMGVKEEIGRFTTTYACCLPRVSNIQTVSNIVNGYLVRPGETFSLNEVVGRRDTSARFVGDSTSTVVAGTTGTDVAGISQFATTMFNAVVRAGLKDVEHTPHEVYLPQYPAGLEAAISYPGPDLRWRNDSPYGVLIQAEAGTTSVTVTLWSTKRYEVKLGAPIKTRFVSPPTRVERGAGCVPVQGRAGFNVEIMRELREDGKIRDRQTFTATYLPQAKVTCQAG